VFKYYKLYIDFDIIKPCLLEVNKKLKNINGSSAFSVGTPIGFPSLDGRGWGRVVTDNTLLSFPAPLSIIQNLIIPKSQNFKALYFKPPVPITISFYTTQTTVNFYDYSFFITNKIPKKFKTL
jgi:hypothetical protein